MCLHKYSVLEKKSTKSMLSQQNEKSTENIID